MEDLENPVEPEIPVRTSKKNKAIIISVLIFLITLAALVLGTFFLPKPTAKNTQEIPQPPELSKAEEKLTPITLKNSDISFHEAKLIKDQESGTSSYTYYSVGNVNLGPFKGYEIILGEISSTEGPCKGPGCGKPFFARYLKKGNQLVLLTKNSEISEIDNEPYFKQTQLSDWEFTQNNEIEIEPFNYPNEFKYKNSLIKYVGQEKGSVDEKLIKIFEDPNLGTVYTTNTAYSPQEPFYNGDEKPYKTSGGWGDGIQSCYNNECFVTNALFTFQPDGTFLMYEYIPSEKTDKVSISNYTIDNEKYNNEYNFITRNGCSGNNADFISVTNPSIVSLNELKEIGQFEKSKNKIYFFKNTEHSYLKHFYDKYKLHFPDISMATYSPKTDQKPVTYEEFVENYPLVFFEDDFGRLIRLTKSNFVPPYACEPIIYLYPEAETNVQIKVNTKIIGTEPEYLNGWNVWVKPNGEITDKITKKTYPYLFWEGTLDFLPKRTDGFVIKRENVEQELREILPRLGLNEKESNDFVSAWAHRLNEAPYYFVTFHNLDTIDTYAPLTVRPQPQTIIRVLMEYEPLKEYKFVEQFKFQPLPERTGFTLVEWGGIEK